LSGAVERVAGAPGTRAAVAPCAECPLRALLQALLPLRGHCDGWRAKRTIGRLAALLQRPAGSDRAEHRCENVGPVVRIPVGLRGERHELAMGARDRLVVADEQPAFSLRGEIEVERARDVTFPPGHAVTRRRE